MKKGLFAPLKQISLLYNHSSAIDFSVARNSSWRFLLLFSSNVDDADDDEGPVCPEYPSTTLAECAERPSLAVCPERPSPECAECPLASCAECADRRSRAECADCPSLEGANCVDRAEYPLPEDAECAELPSPKVTNCPDRAVGPAGRAERPSPEDAECAERPSSRLTKCPERAARAERPLPEGTECVERPERSSPVGVDCAVCVEWPSPMLKRPGASPLENFASSFRLATFAFPPPVFAFCIKLWIRLALSCRK